MIELQDGMLLYHGSYIGIPAIDLNRCFGGLDFGRGFYLTSSYEQAYNSLSMRVVYMVFRTSIQLRSAFG